VPPSCASCLNGSITVSLPEPADGDWRISNYADLSGNGGVRAAGRWHSQGRRIVYLADHPSSALLEMLVHMDRDLIPATYQLLRIVLPPDIAIETAIGLSPNWRTEMMASRQVGDRWLDRSTSALLQMPSAISQRGYNFLLNPAHPDAAKIVVAEIIRAPFDSRLFK
jgi:RES domain-containing protein